MNEIKTSIFNSDLSENTKRSYLELIGVLESENIETVEDLNAYASRMQWSDNTYNLKIRIIKSLHKKYNIYPMLSSIPLKGNVKVNSHNALMPKEYELLVSYLKVSPSRYSKAALIMLLTGVRYSEVEQLWNIKGKTTYITEPKTNKKRLIYLPKLPDAFYVQNYELPSRKMLNTFLKTALKFDVDITSHSLRASYITYMYYSGMSIENLALLTGKIDRYGNPVFNSLLPYLKLRQELVVTEAEEIYERKHLDLNSQRNLKKEIRKLQKIIAMQNRIINSYDDKAQRAILSPNLLKIHDQFMNAYNSEWKKAVQK